jgi:hypothetical protein
MIYLLTIDGNSLLKFATFYGLNFNGLRVLHSKLHTFPVAVPCMQLCSLRDFI